MTVPQPVDIRTLLKVDDYVTSREPAGVEFSDFAVIALGDRFAFSRCLYPEDIAADDEEDYGTVEEVVFVPSWGRFVALVLTSAMKISREVQAPLIPPELTLPAWAERPGKQPSIMKRRALAQLKRALAGEAAPLELAKAVKTEGRVKLFGDFLLEFAEEKGFALTGGAPGKNPTFTEEDLLRLAYTVLADEETKETEGCEELFRPEFSRVLAAWGVSNAPAPAAAAAFAPAAKPAPAKAPVAAPAKASAAASVPAAASPPASALLEALAPAGSPLARTASVAPTPAKAAAIVLPSTPPPAPRPALHTVAEGIEYFNRFAATLTR